MRKVYPVIFLLVLVGAAVSYWVKPSDKEVSLILFKEQVDSRYGEVEANFRKRLEQGDVTVDVVTPLVKMYLESGAVDKAIAVMEQYVAKKPDDIAARKQLGTLYQYAQRPDDYLHNLEALYAMDSNREVLKTLSDVYSFNGQYEKQAAVLREIIKKNEHLEPQQALDLANILAANKNNDEAIKTLQVLVRSKQVVVPFDAVQLLISLLMDVDNGDEAYKEALEWKKKAKAFDDAQYVEQMARLVNLIHFKGSPKIAQKLLDTFGEDVFRKRALLHEQVLLYLSAGQDDKAYAILTKLYESKVFPEELLDSYLLLAVKRGDEATIKTLSEHLSAQTMDEVQAVALLELAVANKRAELLAIMESSLNNREYREAHPLFSVVMALALKEKDVDVQITDYVSSITLTETQQLTIARNCVYAGKPDCADRFLQEFVQSKALTPQKVAAAGSLYIEMKRYADGLSFVERNRNAYGSAEVEQVWVRLAAANGKTAEIEQWMEKHPDAVTSGLLHDVYFLAYDTHHDDLAALAANVLRGQSDAKEVRSMLAQVYIRQGKFADALALYKADGTISDEDADNYIGALIATAAKNPSYRHELGEFAEQQLRDTKISAARKMSLVYALIDAGRLDVAMPFVKDYAQRLGGQWVYVYAENLERQGRKDEARAFWLSAASQKGVTVSQRRQIAFHLLDKGYRGDAEQLFMQLAEQDPKARKDVEQLLYIWGPRPTETQLLWLYERAQKVTGDERAVWMRYIYNYAGHEATINLVADHPDMLQDTQFFSQYLEALHVMGYDDHMVDLVKELDAPRYTEKHMRILARYAYNNTILAVAKQSYAAVLKRMPRDEEALRVLGTMAMNAADYSEAKHYLSQYLDVRVAAKMDAPESYEAYYFYGSMLRDDGFETRAKPYFEAVIRVVDGVKTPDSDMLSKRAQAQAMLGDVQAAKAAFDALLVKYPDNAIVRADYVSTLLALKSYDGVRPLLDKPVVEASMVVAGEPLRIEPKRGYAAYRVVADNREVLFAFDPVRRPAQPLTEAEIKAYPWIAYVNASYDRTLLVVKDGLAVEAVTEEDGTVVLVPVVAKSDDAQYVASQTRLRYALLKARTELEDGSPQKAIDMLQAIETEYKTDPQYLGFMANAENYAGRWPRALRLLREASALTPENEDIAILKRDIERNHAQHVKLDYAWRSLGKHDEYISTLTGFATVAEGWDVGIMAQNDMVRSGSLQRADGRIGAFNGTRQQGEVFIRHTAEDGMSFKASLFGNNDTLGGGLLASVVHALGQTTALLEWQRPFTDYVEAVLDNATRDKVGIEHVMRPTSALQVSLDAGLNRYDVEGHKDVMRTFSVGGRASYEILDDAELAVVYGLDAEYELDYDDAFLNGDAYRPFPLRTSEIHTLALAGHHDFARDDTLLQSYVEWLLGYAVDRLGGHGPVAELRLTHELNEYLEAQARASYGIGLGQSKDDVIQAGGYVMMRY